MLFLTTRQSRAVLVCILIGFLGLCVFGTTNMGVVGEVAWTWVAADPSSNLASPPPNVSWGPLTASSTRPMATLTIGSFNLPLAINLYTGGLADWPARLASPLGWPAIMAVHLIGGAFFIALVHRFLRIHASAIAACCASLLLATDWVFVFFRQALGGTELLLHASVLLCLWSIWSRRWAGGRHGLTAFAAGVGLGLTAKLTFVLSLFPLMLTSLILRQDKPRLRPPLPSRWLPIVLAVTLPMIPMLIAWTMHAQSGLEALASHDHLATQMSRLSDTFAGKSRPARESIFALQAWLGNGSSFLGPAWGANAPSWLSTYRFLGWSFILLGSGLAWLDRDPTPRLALTRFCSVFLPLQVACIWIVARDLHHLAIATPTLMILAGLCIDTICGHLTAKGSVKRIILAFLCCVPWAWSGINSISGTDQILDTIERPTVSTRGQQNLVNWLNRHDVKRLVTLDYESAGSLDILEPSIEYFHGWTRILTNRRTALTALIKQAEGGHLLVIPQSPAWTYNLRPREADLVQAAERVGVDLVVVDHLPDGAADLYAVGSQKGQP